MIIDIVKSIICFLIVLILSYRYLKNRGEIVQLIFIAFAFKYFSLSFIGPTIDVLYTFSLTISIIESLRFSKKIQIKKSIIYIIFTPFLISFFFFFLYFFQSNHFLNEINPIVWYLKTSANYLKTFLPYFFVGALIASQSKRIEISSVFTTILKIATVSSYIAIFQLIFFVLFYSQKNFLDLIGLIDGGRHYEYQAGNINLVRVQSFFYEPKSLAAFLALSIPIAFFLKQKKKVLFYFVVGILTLSQTFFVILFAAFITFVLFNKVKKIRSLILFGSITIILTFFSIAFIRDYILDNYMSQEESLGYKVFIERAVNRYNYEESDYKRELWGIPLQTDIELPAVNFLRDNNIFLITGFGSGNYNLIPTKYFISKWNLDALEKGTFKGHFDMGWVYIVAEFGFIYFVIIFLFLTNFNETGFAGRYYSFMWLVFFFHRIDFLLVAMFCLLYFKKTNNEGINSYHFVQSR